MTGLSLFTIEDSLRQLMEAREEVMMLLAEPTNPLEEAENQRALLEIDKSLQEYITAEIRKCDGIHGWLKQAKMVAEAAKQEAREYADRARRIEANAQRLKDLCLAVMEQNGLKRIDGTAGRYLLRKGNGGVEPLVVQEDVLPTEYREITVRMAQPEWDRLNKFDVVDAEVLAVVPDNKRIREALKDGPVAGAHLEARGAHLETR